MAKQPQEFRWGIIQIRKTAARLGSVYASDEQSAIQRAIDEFEVKPAVRNRLVAQRGRVIRNLRQEVDSFPPCEERLPSPIVSV
jgi:hypothetical protein